MGCEVQVHEKTDKRGTWAFHSVDGWYLLTSPEHHRVHNCQIKQMKKERLSDTVQFKHKSITNLTASPIDKLMNALANCKAALDGKIAQQPNEQLQQLPRLVINLEEVGKQQRETENKPVTRVQEPPAATSRVPVQGTASSRVQVAQQYNAAVHITAQQVKACRRRSLAGLTMPVHFPNAPPAKSTRSHTSRLRQPTQSSPNELRQANAVLQRGSIKQQSKH